ncbi:MAG: addiction module protein [Gammaproteobacteria bacterium]
MSEEDRAELAQKLLLSLEQPILEDIDALWLAEAHRRAIELDEGNVQSVFAETVRRKAQALLK